MMDLDETLQALRELKMETGSLACMGCGHENNCGIHGCAILRRAEELLREQGKEQVRNGRWVPEEHEDRVSPTITNRYTWYYCSECGRRLIGYTKLEDAPYCHCGAKMDGGVGDEAAVGK